MKSMKGIKLNVIIHPMLWLMAAASFLTGQFLSFFILFMLVIFHEAAHGLTAAFFKWDIKKLTLMPFGGQLEVKGILNKSISEEMAVAISGPLFHILLHLLLVSVHPSIPYFEEIYYLNIQLLIFNLLPVWPLDGGRMVYCVLCLMFPFKKSIHLSVMISIVCLTVSLVVMIDQLQFQWLLLFIYSGVSIWLMHRNRHMQHHQFILEKWNAPTDSQKKKVEIIDAEVSVRELIDRLYKGRSQQFILLKDGKMIGNVSDDMIIKRYFSAIK
ncbi:site-2 protease family protein [Jeotgalibacillus salarius]|uniref:Peptidase M50 domain-containing protein n=1 Tax=Jeotgalibacillus salarius TaxID=546023 RepID=A0A4Y8LE74_9BACL|nr:site-2 protease family protein [Jeotgalibacillus salarius]TFE01031.1 hypothetical protein E2626_10225 [Jeotgalibacillus salarius]